MSTSSIPGYGQEAPTEKTAVQSLSEAMGAAPAQTAWSGAVRGAGKSSPVVPIEDLECVTDTLIKSDNGLVRVAARSLKIRIITYKALARKVGA
jgi:hypothetical protein